MGVSVAASVFCIITMLVLSMYQQPLVQLHCIVMTPFVCAYVCVYMQLMFMYHTTSLLINHCKQSLVNGCGSSN